MKNIVEIGQLNSSDISIFIDKDVLSGLKKAARDNVEKQIYALLLGEHGNDGNVSVTISDFIISNDVSSGSDMAIGWFKSNPKHGVFLSLNDMNMHRSYYGNEYNIAITYDPVRDELACYSWHGPQFVPSGGYFIYESESNKSVQTSSEDKQQKSCGHLPVILGSIFASFIIVKALRKLFKK